MTVQRPYRGISKVTTSFGMTGFDSLFNRPVATVAAAVQEFRMQQRKTMNRVEWGLLVLLSVLWGGAFFRVGIALIELPPLTVVLARVGIAAVFLLVLSWILGDSLP